MINIKKDLECDGISTLYGIKKTGNEGGRGTHGLKVFCVMRFGSKGREICFINLRQMGFPGHIKTRLI